MELMSPRGFQTRVLLTLGRRVAVMSIAAASAGTLCLLPAGAETDSAQSVTPKAAEQSESKPVETKPEASTGASSTTKDVSATSMPTAPSTPAAGDAAVPKDPGVPEAAKPAVEPSKSAPCDRPLPQGQAAAVKLYSAGKFALAAKEFQKFIQVGTADVDTHGYLAYCLYNMRQYRRAVKEFDWVEKYGTKTLSLQRSAESSSQTLRSRMAGICPGNCLKPNDSRWQHLPGLEPGHMWIKFPKANGWAAISDRHMGQVVVSEHGAMVNKGVCPICGGSGRVSVLHDGDPVPQ